MAVTPRRTNHCRWRMIMGLRKGWSVKALVGVAALAAVTVLGVSRSLPATPAQAGVTSAMAVLRGVAGEPVGLVTFTQDGGKVRVQADVYGLPPGFHGFHVHAVGSCDPSTSTAFSSAGGHFNPAGHDHGHHGGDMPVLYVLSDGTGALSFTTDGFAVADLFDADGSAVIVHANPDNYANIPARYVPEPDAATLATGDAGGRIACAVVASADLAASDAGGS